MITLRVRGREALEARLLRVPRDLVDSARPAAESARRILDRQVRANVRRQFNNPREMLSAIGSEVRETRRTSGFTGTSFEVVVDASGALSGVRLPYMAIHERGGRTRAHQIFPRRRQALHFFAAAGSRGRLTAYRGVFTRRVNHPGSRIPARSYLRRALDQRRNEITALFRAAVTRAVAG